MLFEELIIRREARRGRALAKDPACLSSWSFAGDAELVSRVMRRLEEAPLAPSPRWVQASLAEASTLPRPDAGWDAAEHLHRARLGEAIAKAPPAEASAVRAWALENLGWLGEEVERRERAAWRDASYLADPAHDAECAALWAQWLSGNPWAVRKPWERLFLPAARRSFHAVLEARRVPQQVRARSLEDLEEAFFYVLLGGAGNAPGWMDLALRVLETSGDGPVDRLAALLGDAGRTRLSLCATTRGHWPETASFLFPSLGAAGARAQAIEKDGLLRAGRLEPLLDLHVVLRLIATWCVPGDDTGHPDRSWAVVVQNRGRARGRLRALLATLGPEAIAAPLLALDELHARTLAAVRRFSWAWAWQALARDFAFDASRAASPPCEEVQTMIAPIGPEDGGALTTWVLLVVLKGRLHHLDRWVRTGGTGDRDSTWARMLSDELPAALLDPPIEGRRAATYHRLRAALADSLNDRLASLRPILEKVAALPETRTLKDAFEAAVAGAWDPAVRMPKSGFPTIVEHAGAALASVNVEAEVA